MDSERWQRIETLFDAALDLAPYRWDTFLDDHCRNDPTLRAEVAALLAAHVPPSESARKPGKGRALDRLVRWRRWILVGALLLTIAALVTALRINVSRKTEAIHRGLYLEDDARAARKDAYVNAIAAAEASIRALQIDDARALLARTPADLRGWEWRHLSRRLDRSLYAIAAHSKDVTRIAFGHDGSYFVTSSLDSTIAFWRAGSGELLHRAGPFTAGVVSVAIHPADTTIAAGLADGTVLLYDPDRDEVRGQLAGRGRAMVAFHPDGSRLAAAFNDGTLTEWRLDTLKPTGSIKAGGSLLCATYSLDGAQLIAGDAAGRVTIWDTRTRRRIAEVKAHDRRIMDVAAGRGGMFATASQDHAVRIWRLSDRRLVTEFNGHDGTVAAVAFMSDGARMVSAGADRRVLRWTTGAASIASGLDAGDDVRAIAIDPAGMRIAVGGANGGVRVWPANAEDVRTFRAPADSAQAAAVNHARMSRNGSLLAGASDRRAADLWDAATGEHVARMETGRAHYLTRVAFDADGSHLFAGDRGGNVIVFDTVRQRRLLAFAAHSAAVTGLGISPDGGILVSAAADSTMKFWDARTLAPRGEVHGLSGSITRLTFAPAGTLATASTDRAIRFWSAASGDTLRVHRGHGATVIDLAFSPDGESLVSLGTNDEVRLWSTATGATTGAMEAPRTLAVCFTPDGERIVLGGADRMLRIVETGSLREVARLHGHTGPIVSLELSPRGDAVVSASSDGTIRLWDAE